MCSVKLLKHGRVSVSVTPTIVKDKHDSLLLSMYHLEKNETFQFDVAFWALSDGAINQ